MKKLIVLALVFGISLPTFAQKVITEGVIFSKQTVSTDNAQMKPTIEAIGEVKATTFFKNGNSRGDLSNPMTGDVTTISTPSQILVLMNNPALGKVYMLQTPAEVMANIQDVSVTEGSETKTILGYECKQYIAKLKQAGSDIEMILYTTEAINAKSPESNMLGDKLKGFPLHMVMTMNQMGMKLVTTTEVEKIVELEVSDDKFSMTIPEGYNKM